MKKKNFNALVIGLLSLLSLPVYSSDSSVDILSVGFEASSSVPRLIVANMTTLGFTAGDYLPISKIQGFSYGIFKVNDFFLRNTAGTGCNTMSYIKGISIDNSYLTPSTLRSWIKQIPTTQKIDFGSSGTTYMSVGGTVGIGTTNPNTDYKLDVNGLIHSSGIIVDAEGIADFVFRKDYVLPELSEVEHFIEENGHLPNVPNDEEVKKNGLNVVEMQTKMLQKIEELTLYIIELQKEVESLKASK